MVEQRSFLDLPLTFWVLWLGALVNRLGGFVFTFLALYLTEGRKFTPLEAGISVAIYGAGSFAAAGFGGWLADRHGRRFGILFGTVTGAAAMLVLGWVESLWAVRLAALCSGFFGDSYRPSLNAAVADVVPVAERTRAYATLYWAVNLGFAVAASSAGWLARSGYHWLFIVDAATTLAFGAIAFFFLPETRPLTAFAAAEASPSAWWEPFRSRVFLHFAAAQFVVIVLLMQSQVSLPLALLRQGFSADRYGSLIAINGVLILILQPVTAAFLARRKLSNVLAAGALLTGLGFGVNALASTLPVYVMGLVLWTFGEIGYSAAAPAFVAKIAPAHARGVYQGAFHMLWGGAFVIAPLVGTGAIEMFSIQTLWLGCLMAGSLAAIAHYHLPTLSDEPAYLK